MRQEGIPVHRSSMAFLYRLLDGVIIFTLLIVFLHYFGHRPSKDWLIVGLTAVAVFAFLAESVELYRSWRTEKFTHMLMATGFAWIAACTLLTLLGYFTKLGPEFSRLVIGFWFTSAFTLLLVWRLCVRKLLFHLRIQDRNIRSAVVIGATESAARLAEDLARNPQLGVRLEGYYCVSGCVMSIDKSSSHLPSWQKLVNLGDISGALEAARKGQLDLVYIALPMREERHISKILAELADSTATVYMIPDFFVANMMHSRWHQVGESQLLSIYDTPIVGLNSWFKRLEDLLLSSVILLLISPFMLVIAIGVRLSSPGPIIFRQRRYGLDGRVIDVWKFRSMACVENGEKVTQARREDPRITPFGAFLRRTSLDELPQFINVLQGSMSIVGPRPHAVSHNEEYRGLVSGYMLRHKVKPGITGWAQVNGWRGETDSLEKMRNRVEHDLHYIRNWSVLLDLKIVFLTLFKGFTGENAY